MRLRKLAVQSVTACLCALLAGMTVFAADPPRQDQRREARQTQGERSQEEQRQQAVPIPLPITVVETEAQARQRLNSEDNARSHEHDDLRAQQSMAKSAETQATATLVATFASGLAAFLLILTLAETRRTTNAAIAEAMPYLVPRVTKIDLHPHPLGNDLEYATSEAHRPRLKLVFRNVGRTVAELRSIRLRLELVRDDRLPATPPNLMALIPVETSAIVAPDDDGGARWFQYDRNITGDEINALIRDGSASPLLRVYALGVVVYDDVFDTRHTHYFCLKVRHGFEALRGGRAYNRVERGQAPKANDEVPIDAPEEEVL